jgi:CheY-like chemotaxis protein
MKILIADDDAASRVQLGGLARELGHDAIVVNDGVEALAEFVARQPDLVLLDGCMPRVDGYEATARIRALDTQRWTPILFVAAESDGVEIARALDAGADDYLVKPVHPSVLRAKISALTRVQALHQEGEAQQRRLQKFHDAAEHEGRITGHLMKKLINAGQLDDPILDCMVVPIDKYSGDLVAAARTPRGILHVMLADAVGHGLAAALNLLPIVPCFYAMTAKGFNLDMIAVELNRTLRQYMPVDRFVATTLIAVDEQARRITVWNGGNPDVVAFDDAGAVMARFASRNLAVGIVPEAAFEPVVEEFEYSRSCQLFACSDGVVEDYGNVGADLERQQHVEDMLAQTPPLLRIKRMRAALSARTDDGSAGDDMAVVLLRCDVAVPAVRPALPRMPAQWQFNASFDIADLRRLDVVGMVLNVIEGVPGAYFHRRQLGVVVAELFANALDHGLLELPPALKSAGGLEVYGEARSAALTRLDRGSIDIQVESQWRDGRPLLVLRVRDSGAGFDAAAVRAGGSDDRRGRGIDLVRALCASVEYNARGNEVRVVYALEDSVAEPLRAVA